MIENSTEDALKVLLVDDEMNILLALKRLLMDEEFDVITASSGAEALEMLDRVGDVALIVSDQRMPGLSGAEFLERARDVAPDAVRMVLTGYADVAAAVDAINKGGAHRYLNKPWDDEELLRSVREAVEKYRLVRENRRLTETVKRQNAELKDWNANLKIRVLEQTSQIRRKNEELHGLNSRLTRNYGDSILAFSRLIELRDREVRNHSGNVAKLSAFMAEDMGLKAEEIETVRVSSLLHDIGKIGVSDLLLQKGEEEMTELEREAYVQHTVRGQAAIDSIEDLRGAGLLVRHHHECYDGSGFPDRLRGEDIPLGARIIAMADHVDRSVRKLSGNDLPDLVLADVEPWLGKRFDPRLFPFLERGVRECCGALSSAAEMTEMECRPADLLAGMVLARDLCSGTGILLLGRGAVLDIEKIAALKRYYRIDPPADGVFVLVRR